MSARKRRICGGRWVQSFLIEHKYYSGARLDGLIIESVAELSQNVQTTDGLIQLWRVKSTMASSEIAKLRGAVNGRLTRLEKQGELKRLSHGLYSPIDGFDVLADGSPSEKLVDAYLEALVENGGDISPRVISTLVEASG